MDFRVSLDYFMCLDDYLSLAGVALRRIPHQSYHALVLYRATLTERPLELAFFAWHHGGLAFADTVLLWATVVATLFLFWRVSPLAGVLLIPYLLWVGCASALNYSLWKLNPLILG